LVQLGLASKANNNEEQRGGAKRYGEAGKGIIEWEQEKGK